MIETREYPVPLTDAELLTAADIAGMISAKIAERKAAFAAVKEKFRENMKDLQLCLAEQMEKLSTKKELRETTLRIEFNHPEEGKKQIFDFATGELYEVCDMTEDDWNNIFVCERPAVVLHPAEEHPEEEDPDLDRRRQGSPTFTGNTIGAAMDEEAGKNTEVCSVCKECHSVLHINGNKPICAICRDQKNAPQLDKIKDLAAHWQGKDRAPRYRASFGFGCTDKYRDTTCIRFMLPSGSWGNPVYLGGDYEYPGSQSHSFIEQLKKEGWLEG